MRNMNIKNQHGVALVEVLIVFFVLSIGLLGMAALQMKSIQYNQSAYLRSQATVAANDMLDRIRLNGGVALTTGTGTDYQAWLDFLSGTLPIPSGTPPSVTCNGTPVICTITITWNDRPSGTASVVISSQM